MTDDLTPPHWDGSGPVSAPRASHYVSPHGKPRGLARRLAEWAERMGTDKGLPWAGLGIIRDLQMATHILNKREWLEAMRLSDDPEAQRFAEELLGDDETLDAAWNAAEHVKAAVPEFDTLDPVAAIETLDAAAVEAQRDYRAVRAVLVDAGALADDDTETPIADLVRALMP